MGFGTLTMTTAGNALLTKVRGGATLLFTKAQAGSGLMSAGQTPATMTALVTPKQDMAIGSVYTTLPDKLTVRLDFDNHALSQGYYWREIGLFAQDPNVGEILYAYSNAADEGSYMPAGTDGLTEEIIDLAMVVSNVASITVHYDNTVVNPAWSDLVINGVIPCAGTGTNTITVSNANILDYADGMRIALDMGTSANTGAVTININGKGAKAAVTQTSAGGTAALSGGETAGITVWQYKASISSFVLVSTPTDTRIGSRTISDSTTPTGDTGLLSTLLGWLANMIKQITGKSSWRTAPIISLESVNNHVTASSGVHGAVSAATASRIITRDTNGRAQVADPSAAADITTKNYVDTGLGTKLPANGGTIQNYSETMVTNATATGNVTIDVANGNVINLTLTGAVTLTFPTGLATGKAFSFTLIINQGTTAYSVTWPAALKWDNNAIPDLSAVSKTSILVFETFNGGTRWYGRLAMSNLTT